jgi:putative tryptophan/tyrosine transport system substrate-binding protein
MKVIGILNSGSPELLGEQFAAFHRGLREAGYIDGQNVTVEYRWAYNDYRGKLPALAKELVQHKVDVIVAAGGTISALAARDATKSKMNIPVVFTAVSNPKGNGLEVSNLTGIAGLTTELDPKRLELLHAFTPKARTIGVLANLHRPGSDALMKTLKAAADKLKLKLAVVQADPTGDLENSFGKLAEQKVEALLVAADPYFNSQRTQVVAKATKLGVPAIYQWSGFVAAGGLMSYGPRIADAYRQTGIYAGRLLGRAKVANLPIVLPNKFDLYIHRDKAKAFGEIPSQLLTQAIVPPKERANAEINVVSTYTSA